MSFPGCLKNGSTIGAGMRRENGQGGAMCYLRDGLGVKRGCRQIGSLEITEKVRGPGAKSNTADQPLGQFFCMVVDGKTHRH